MTERRFNPHARPNPKHQQPVRQVDRPEPGWFKMRLGRKCPWVAARITYGPPVDPETGEPMESRSPVWCGEIDGEPDPNPTPAPTETVMRIWTSGEPISQGDHDFMVARAQWARAYAPHLPEANPRTPIDLRTLDVSNLFPERQDAR